MSSRSIRTGLARPGVTRLRTKGGTAPQLARPPEQAQLLEPRELWVGLHLPWIALEAFEAAEIQQSSAHESPRAVVELHGQTQYIVTASPIAQRAGVRSGMGMAAALALVPKLETMTRDLVREQQVLERVASRAHRFTPRVSLVPPDGLVLEVKGSLHLFGGAEKLCEALAETCYEIGIKPLVALAPSPLAALAGARAGKPLLITDPAHLVGQIASLQLSTLRWSAEVLDRLRQVGVYTIGQVLRLPRAAFARRFGQRQLLELDRLTGRDTDLRERFRLNERFRRKHDLLYELEHHEAILNTLTPVLEELGDFLQARQCGVTRLACLLKHRHAPTTRCVLKLAAPAASAKHLVKLLGEKLAGMELPEPVRSCEIRTGDLIPRAPAKESLWRAGEHGGGASPAAPELVEHLRARLGHEAVYGLRVVESHCPERAWATAGLSDSSMELRKSGVSQSVPWAAHRRPLWLLQEPQLLTEQAGLPFRNGVLRLLEGPECVETGWWVRGDVARDYYVALDAHGIRLWVFRDRQKPHRWFLQGLFG